MAEIVAESPPERHTRAVAPSRCDAYKARAMSRREPRSDAPDSSAGPTRDAWRAEVERGLGGRSYDDLAWRTDDGFTVEPLVTRGDVAQLAHLTGGAYRLLQRRKGWRVRELIVCGDPERSAELARAALASGADEIEIVLDALAQDAQEPEPFPEDGDADAQESWTAPGHGGVAVHRFEDFVRCLDGIDLAKVRVSVSGGEAALPALAWLVLLADRRGVPRARLAGELDLDPIARMTMRQLGVLEDGAGPPVFVSQRSTIEQVFDEAAAVIGFCARECPELRPIALDGQSWHLAGASPAIEVAATLAGAIECARRLAERGVDFDRFARASVLRVQVSHELLIELAKLRALRLLWAKVAHAFEAADGASLTPLVTAITSGRSRAQDFDLRTNLVRSAIAAFAAVAGGADSIAVFPFDDDPIAQDASAPTLARNQQLLLRHEAHLDRSADPFGGSFAVELLTDRVARAAWDELQAIESTGGLLAAIQNGHVAQRVEALAERRRAAFHRRERTVIGISRVVDPRLGARRQHDDAADAAEDERVEERLAAAQVHRARRNRRAVEDTLAELRAARGPAIVEAALLAADAGATAAEIAQAGWPPEGTGFRHHFVPVSSTDGADFEHVRDFVEQACSELGPHPVWLLPIGRAARARADFARDLLLAGGFLVEDPGPLADVAAARALVEQHAPAVVVLCGDDAEARAWLDALWPAIAARRPRPRVLVASRPGPEHDARVTEYLFAGADVLAALERLAADLFAGGETHGH